MIDELRLKTETFIKTIDKKNITERIIGLLESYEVMFIYFGGSLAYNVFDSAHSDIDVIVFVDGYDGFNHSDIDGFDLFIYGKEYMMKRFECDESMPEYYVIFNDDKLTLPKTLIYLNSRYQKEYEDFINYDLRKSLKKYLKAVYDYFMYIYVDTEIPSKRFYHIIRIKGQIDNYLKTGVFDLTMEESLKEEMLIFKNHFSEPIGQKIYNEKISAYLEFIKETEERL